MTGENWHPIDPLDSAVERKIGHDLATLDAVHRSWQEHRTELGRYDPTYPLHRTLRRHAIETGAIEGLYDIDPATADVMVIKGLTRGADAGVGEEVPPGVLEMLKAQKEGLEMVINQVQQGHGLTTSFIKELHALITRAQPFWFVTDSVGRYVQVMLNHGSFKSFPNSVKRADGTRLDFAPPDRVAREIQRLIDMYEAMTNVHPVVSAAWLHHRFVHIHPFQDGNGRVARALTAHPLEKGRYPPVVVDRNCRDAYLRALDEANNGDLAPLGRLFAKLAIRSIRRELDESILDSFADMTMEDDWLLGEIEDPEELRRIEETSQREADARMRADRFHEHTYDWLRETRLDIEHGFAAAGQQARVWTDRPTPFDSRSRWWRREIVKTARRAEHYASFKSRPWWSMLGMTVNGVDLRFVTSIHHVAGAYTGVMAITSFGTIRRRGEEYAAPDATFVETSWEPFTFSLRENVEDRVGELHDWLDQSLAVALKILMRRTLGI